MGERHPAFEPFARRPQGVAHVAEQQQLGRRHAIGMGREVPLAYINRPIGA